MSISACNSLDQTDFGKEIFERRVTKCIFLLLIQGQIPNSAFIKKNPHYNFLIVPGEIKLLKPPYFIRDG